jgi:hypothetical protein
MLIPSMQKYLNLYYRISGTLIEWTLKATWLELVNKCKVRLMANFIIGVRTF